MELKLYEMMVKDTAVYPEEVKNFGIAYCVLGLFDEMNEVMEKVDIHADYEEIKKEVFDVIWYVAALCRELDISFQEVVEKGLEFHKDPDFDPVSNQDGKFEKNPFGVFGPVKKFFRDGKEIDKANISVRLSSMVAGAVDNLHDVDKEFPEGLQANYEKLMSRKERGVLQGSGDNR